MTRRFLCSVALLYLGVSLPARAQSDFSATAATITVAEGGSQDILVVETDGERFSLFIPIGYGSQVRAESRSIIFTSSGGDSAITLRFTTNYAGGLPRQEMLRDEVAARHQGASLVATSAASTGFGTALSFELFRPAANGLMLRTRDVYAAYPEGSVELAFSCSSVEFDKQKLGFARLLNSFRLLTKDAKTTP
jgi:hypothetical protein